MTSLEFAVIVVFLTLVLSTLVVLSLRRFHRQCDHINEAKKALLAAHIKHMRARARHAERKFSRAVRRATNSDFSQRGVGVSSNLTQAS
jgi:hypothetical protein